MICVIHLVRKANGLEPVRAFIDSYRRHEAGTEHELILLLKGFDSDGDADDVLALADVDAGDALFLADEGFDVGAYLAAAHQLGHETFCFLNSFSVIQSADWLRKLASPLNKTVGLVGASGSHASHYSWLLYDLGFGSYRKIIRRDAARVRALDAARAQVGDFRHPLRRAVGNGLLLPHFVPCFDPFPSCHVRTNAFLVRRDVIQNVRSWPFRRKIDAWKFESGRRCLTRQVENMGLRALVVGADGNEYEKKRWHASNTFWQSNQENLLVADNQSRDYRDGDADRRIFLSLLAWGANANPAFRGSA
jgi:hypothetical protein